jgi:acyl carrier protein
MTEASHQIASNPLPPGRRKPGSVGLATGPEVAIMDADGQIMGAHAVGEVVIRGENVTAGYLNHATANAAAFRHGWFRTGDLGYLDEDGYLYLTGRLKEIINRGGEKISPREIDQVLLEHPAVLQAVAFGVPHHRLGEEVGAAVVLRAGASASGHDLREFAAKRLADFKIPAKMVFMERIPTGPTGKLQRIGLAEALGLTGAPAVSGQGKTTLRPPATDTERKISGIWRDLLGVEQVGIDDNFFDCGGDSLLALRLIARIEEATGRTLNVSDLASQTLSQLASQLDSTGERVRPSGLRRRLKRLAGAIGGSRASSGK